MGRTGLCSDNTEAVSLFATLKNELYHRYRYPTRAHARFAAAEFIGVFYDRKRKHSTIDYRNPVQALADHQLPTETAA